MNEGVYNMLRRKYADTYIRTTSEKYVDIRMSMEDLEYACRQLHKSDPLRRLLVRTYNNVMAVQGMREKMILDKV